MKKADLVAELERRDAGGSAHDLWQRIIDAIPAPIFYKDTDHLYQGCNRAFEAYIGLTHAQICGASVYDVAPKELADIYRKADNELFAARGQQVYQTQVQYADGTYHDVMFHKAVVENPDGSVAGMVGVILDITERSAAEKALRDSQHMFAQLVENMPDPVFVHDADGNLLQVNERACQSLGYDRETLLAKNVVEFEVGPTPEQLRTAWADFPDETVLMRGRHRAADGRAFPVEAHVSRIGRQADGGAVFIAAVRDISERLAAEARLVAAKQEAEEANRVKTQFLANMSHELRTPLNAILGFSDVIRQQILGTIGTEAYLEYAGDIYASGGHLLRIIDDLLDLSRLEIGDMPFTEERVAVDAVVDASLRLLGDAVAQGRVSLETRIDEGLPDLVCDQRRVSQVLINLVGNAVKFTPAGGVIRIVAARREDGGLVIAVSDTGVGIAEKDLNRVLMPFEQVQNTMTREHAGAGLGLALCKSLVESHDGTLAVESAPGEGTTVSIIFPAARLAG